MMVASDDFEVLSDPIKKSPSDRKDYRLIKLSNGLKVLLVKNTNIGSSRNKSAAVALSVNVGSFDDPFEIQGLSHFLEHIVFMGSPKYPKENEFDQYIKSRNGFDNAMTEVEHTIFYFHIADDALSGALDRFSQFFINPLMQIDAMNREIEAVESEFQNNVYNDTYRMAQIYASMALDKSPVGNFTWGNLKTLKNIKSENLHKSLHEFRKKFYKSNHMKLCIQSSLKLDLLQSIVARYFTDIQPAYGTIMKPISIDPFKDIFKLDFHQKIYYVKSTSKKRKLFMTFLLPSIEKDYKNKSLDYLAYLFNYEGRYSLNSYLRKKSLAINVNAKIGWKNFEGNSLFTFFTIDVGLTRDGYENIYSVLDAIFSFILTIKMTPMEVHRETFEEFRELKEILFKYRKEKQQLENVQELVLNMMHCKDEDIVVGKEIFNDFDKASLKKFIELINDRRFNLLILSEQHQKYDKVERWFGTQYAVEDFPHKLNRLWNERWIRKDFELPQKSRYIPKNFDLIMDQEAFDTLRMILKTDVCKCFFKPDLNFSLPHVFIYIHFMSSLTHASVDNLNMTSIYSMCVKSFLSEKLYQATIVGYAYKLNSVDDGLVLKLSGFNEKLPLILEVITKAMKNITELVDKHKFEDFKKDLRKNCYNFLINSNQFVEELLVNTINSNHKFYFDRFKAVDKINFNGFKEFIMNFLTTLKFKILIQGNLNKNQAVEICEDLLKSFNHDKIKLTKKCQSNILKIPIGSTYLKVKSLLPNDKNSIVKNYYQIDSNGIESQCILEIIVKIMREPLFNTLRTKEQLGYSVSCAIKNDENIYGLSIVVESQEKRNSARHVDSRIEKFLCDFITLLSEMCDDDFETMKSSIINQRRSADIELELEVNRNFSEVREKKYNFERNEIEARQLEILNKNSLAIFFREHILGEHRRKLSIQILANAGDGDSLLHHGFIHLNLVSDDDNQSAVRDLAKFKKSLEVFTR